MRSRRENRHAPMVQMAKPRKCRILYLPYFARRMAEAMGAGMATRTMGRS